MGCNGVLLTGGASTRMGRDKATLVVDGRTLASRTAELLSGVADRCVVVGRGVSGLDAVLEDPPGGGPLVAIAAGVAAVGTDRPALVVACDLPRLQTGLLRWLVDHPSPGSVVPLWEGRPQPLCARWCPAALHAVTGLVADGIRSMRTLVERSDTELVAPPRDMATALQDVDTPEQLAGLAGVDSP
jgi:molybdopterin-guanine dinucleotide biosynthesis protein A